MKSDLRKALEAVRPTQGKRYLVLAVHVPAGNIELITTTMCIDQKIDYVLQAYDDELHLKANKDIFIDGILVG